MSTARYLIATLVAIAALPGLAGCTDAGAGAPASASTPAGRYVTSGGDEPGHDSSWLRTKPLRADFEELNGTVTLVLDGPVNTSNVPISIEGAHGTSNGGSVSLVGCFSTAPDSDCAHDAWLSRLLSSPATYAFAGKEVTITGATGSIVLTAAA